MTLTNNEQTNERGKKAELIKQQKPCLEGWLPGDGNLDQWKFMATKNKSGNNSWTDGDKLSVECDAMEKFSLNCLWFHGLIETARKTIHSIVIHYRSCKFSPSIHNGFYNLFILLLRWYSEQLRVINQPFQSIVIKKNNPEYKR